MYLLEKDFRFEAAHRLLLHDGKCNRLHGHSWRMTVKVRAASVITTGPKTGMVLDYGVLAAMVQPVVDEFLDHHYLNETLAPFDVYPTSENIARWLFDTLVAQVPGLVSITVEETCTCRCTYFGAMKP